MGQDECSICKGPSIYGFHFRDGTRIYFCARCSFMCDREQPNNLVGKERWTEEESAAEFERIRNFVTRHREETNAIGLLQRDVGESEGH